MGNFIMSQSLIALTLPNGTQVVIPAFDSKGGEYMPLVLLGDRSPEPLLDPNSSNVLVSGMQVTGEDIESTIYAGCSSEVTNLQDNLVTNEFESAFPNNTLKCDDKQNEFDNSVIVNSELSEFVDIQRTCNTERDINDKHFDVLRNNSNDNEVHQNNEENLESSTLMNGTCVSSETEEADTLEKMLETCGSVGMSMKSTECTELDIVDCGNSSCSNGNVKDGLSFKTNIKDLNVDENVSSEININEFMDLKERSSTKELVELTDTETNIAEAVVKMSDNVSLTLDVEVEENGNINTGSNNVILDHLDEFAEMVTWFKCRLCKFTAGSKKELLEHLRIEHLEGFYNSDVSKPEDESLQKRDIVSEKLIFLCGQCSAGFNSINACKAHMMQVHEFIVQKAEEGINNGSRTGYNKELLKHRNEGRGTTAVARNVSVRPKFSPTPAPFKCTVRGCQSKFSEEKYLDMHISCHTDMKNCRNFKCSECPTPFERWRSCALHLWKVHKIDCGLLTCPICLTYKTATSVPLENHMRIHGEDRSFTCLECGKGFKQAAQLHNHRVMHMDRKASELPRWYASKQCTICFKNYANSKCLKKHIQAVHSKLRPYVCQVCGHASARKAMLQLHYRQHTGEKPHTCPLCEYRTGDHNSLRRHIMRHTGQRPYRCPHCPYSAIQSNSYKNHLRNKHPGQSGVFLCEQCSFKTVSHEGYMLHISDHKNGIINSSKDGEGSDVEVFPGNVAAAQLIYQCLNALTDNGSIEANVTGSSTSADGTTQTITIQIPNQSCTSENEDEVTRCFLEVQQQLEDDNMDTNSTSDSSIIDQNSLCNLDT